MFVIGLERFDKNCIICQNQNETMIYLPCAYFLGLTLYFKRKEQRWNMGCAAASILVLISFFAILVDSFDFYGQYGINEKAYTFPTLLLFCFQWTITLLPLHYISKLTIEPIPQEKEHLFRIFLWVLIVSACLTVLVIINDVVTIISTGDFLSIRNDHYEEMQNPFDDGSRNYWKVFPALLVSSCFQVLSLLLAMYIFSFNTKKTRLGVVMLLISTIGIISSIQVAGRSAIIYWCFHFYLIYSYFYPYIDKTIKRRIVITIGCIAGIIFLLLLAITFSRFDDGGKNAVGSLVGYAGQHINNFCATISYGSNSPHSSERIFPLFNKLVHHHSFRLADHYDNIESNLSIIVHNFDTFGGEVYLDFGWTGYIICMLCIIVTGIIVKNKWHTVEFYQLFILSIFINFYNYGLFAWPFIGHYTTSSVLLMLIISVLFRYKVKV